MLVPLGPDYEAVGIVLNRAHSTPELLVFAAFKLIATTFTLGVGGVSAMFVPLFLTGGTLGVAFAQSVVHSPSYELYAAVGMASFLAAGYKTPLAAVVFVAEATGGHAFIIPSLIGAAIRLRRLRRRLGFGRSTPPRTSPYARPSRLSFDRRGAA